MTVPSLLLFGPFFGILNFFSALFNFQIHFRGSPSRHPLGIVSPENSSIKADEEKDKEWSMPNEIWSEEEVNNIKVIRDPYRRIFWFRLP